MRQGLDDFDEKRVAAISRDVAAAIDAATFGLGSWDEVPLTLSRAFPGSFGILYNMNFPEKQLNYLSVQNTEAVFATSLAEHFAYINPWAPYWTSVRSTFIAASEEVFPARTFAKSEFYNDWLVPQNRAEAAAGMKIVGERDEAVHLLLHFPLARSELYDKVGKEVLGRVRGNFERSVNLARLLRADVEGALARSALLERSRCAAFVVDGGRLLRDANAEAERLLSAGDGVAVRHGRCHLTDKEADARFGAALEELAAGRPTNAARIAFRTAAGAWQVSLAALPLPAESGAVASLLPPRPMVLVLVADLKARAPAAGDLAVLASLFALTPAEIAFCRRLLLGESVAEAAERLGLTEGTARTRLKAILHKTGTTRQGQLMLLLSRLG
ncbi:MAG: helix-turn-helix transcriptional regulator [Pseudomonadota bacterium]